MICDPNDPRLTAFVLGELDADKRAAVERLVSESPECRQALDEIRTTAQWLTQHLHEEQLTHIAAATVNHQMIEQTLGQPVVPRSPWWRRTRYQLVGLAALLLVGVTMSMLSIVSTAGFRRGNANKVAVLPRQGVRPISPRAFALAPDSKIDPSKQESVAGEPDADYKGYQVAVNTPEPSAGASTVPAMDNSTQERLGVEGGRAENFAERGTLSRSQLQPSTAQSAGGIAGRRVGPRAAANNNMVQNNNIQQAQDAPRFAFRAARSEKLGELADKKLERGLAAQSAPAPMGAEVSSKPGALPALSTRRTANDAEPEQRIAAEAYSPIIDNPFEAVATAPQSTFSIDVDTASYSNIRRFLNQNQLPPRDAVRIEEMLNYFPYHDAPPAATSDDPFAIHIEVAGCPWNSQHRLARIGLAATPIDQSKRPPSNLVFLVDVSGSMDEPNKLPLVQWGLQRLVEQLGENDRVAMVVYAAASGLVLPSTSCQHKSEVMSAIDRLQAGGSTNGGAGIQLAYDVATQHFVKNGTNRVILATDGDFNVGITDQNKLVELIEAKAKSGIFLSVLGFGMGNIKDATLEKIADKGNGHYAYIDSQREAYKTLVEEMGSTLVTVAKDVKIQVEFNAARVAQYRLIGYENRRMANKDFNDDTKDAGEIGAGHHVTAFYELVPPQDQFLVAKLAKARSLEAKQAAGTADPSFTVRLRYKKPNEDSSRLFERSVVDRNLDFGRASDDLKFAAAIAGFGMLLRDSPHKGSLTYDGVIEIAQPTIAGDAYGYHGEAVELVRKAKALSTVTGRAGP
jgi:Ca-activated chloride channel homolog